MFELKWTKSEWLIYTESEDKWKGDSNKLRKKDLIQKVNCVAGNSSSNFYYLRLGGYVVPGIYLFIYLSVCLLER